MAILEGNLFGQLHGKIGSMYGRRQNGKTIIASMPTTNPNRTLTLAERQRRESFAALSSLTSDFTDVINIGLRNYRNKSSLSTPRNAFTHLNKNIYTFDNAGNIVLHFKELLFSFGRLPIPEVYKIAPYEPEGHDVTVSFKDSTDEPGCSPLDIIITVAYCVDLNIHLVQRCTRVDPKLTFAQLPPVLKSHKLQFYAFVLGNDKKETSDTIYLGEILYEPYY